MDGHRVGKGSERVEVWFDREAGLVRMRGRLALPVSGGAQMLLVLSSPNFTSSRVHIAELAIRYRLPAMFIFKTYAQAGGLMSYGADFEAMHRLAAAYVAKVLQGAKPAELPIEQPNRFELVVNLNTAKALGIAIPQPLLLRADELIQ